MMGVVKIIAERDYGEAAPARPDSPHDLRVFHVPPEIADLISDWYRRNGWMVTTEPL